MIDLSDAEIAGMLRRVYNAFENDIFPVLNRLWAQIEKAMPKSRYRIRWGGENAYFPVTVGQPGGLYSSPNGALPPSSAALERQASETVKRLYVRRQVDGLAIVGTQSKEAAFKPLATKIVKEATTASKLGLQRMIHGDSRAIVAVVVTTGLTTCIVSTPYGISGAGQGGLGMEPGQTYQVSNAGTARAVTGGPGNSRVTISAISNSGDNATLTFTGSESVVSMTIGDFLVLATAGSTAFNATAGDTTSQSGEINGFTNMLRRGGSSTYNSLHNVSVATAGNERWDAVRLVAGTDPIPSLLPTEDDIWSLKESIFGRCGMDPMETPSEWLLIGTPGIEQRLVQSVYGQRVLSNTADLKAGYKGITIAGLPFISDYWCPAGTIYLVHLPSLFKINAKDFGYVVLNGAGPWRWVDGYDGFETSWGAYIQTGTARRNAHGMITGYTDSTRYSHVV
jgi:hypothetical protein